MMDIFEDVGDAVNYFQNLFLKTAQKYMSHKTVTIRPKAWFTNSVKINSGNVITSTLDGKNILQQRITNAMRF